MNNCKYDCMAECCKKPDCNVIVLFGATGHLAVSRLIKAIVKCKDTDEFIAIGRSVTDVHEYEKVVKCAVKGVTLEYKDGILECTTHAPNIIKTNIRFINFDINDGDAKYINMALKEISERKNIKKIVFYIAVHTGDVNLMLKLIAVLRSILTCLAVHSKSADRVVAIDKPLGNCKRSAEDILLALGGLRKYDSKLDFLSKELKVMHIDHYLYKKTLLQNIEGKYSNKQIREIKLSMLEYNDIPAERLNLWKTSGGIWGDMVQNHAFNTLAYICGVKLCNIQFKVLEYTPESKGKSGITTGVNIVMLVNLGRSIDAHSSPTKVTIEVRKCNDFSQSYIWVDGDITVIKADKTDRESKCNAYQTIINGFFNTGMMLRPINEADIIASWKICDCIRNNKYYE